MCADRRVAQRQVGGVTPHINRSARPRTRTLARSLPGIGEGLSSSLGDAHTRQQILCHRPQFRVGALGSLDQHRERPIRIDTVHRHQHPLRLIDHRPRIESTLKVPFAGCKSQTASTVWPVEWNVLAVMPPLSSSQRSASIAAAHPAERAAVIA